MSNDYSKTLNLPKTEFPMKADLVRKEPDIMKRWLSMDIYGKSQTKNAPKGEFILHDGPPYSNGPIHMGTALNKILKDFVIKYKTMNGYRAPYVPGFDNHGMPIENAVTKKLQESGKVYDKIILRKACRSHATKFMKVQTEQFERLGVFGDWSNPYFTMDPTFEAAIIRVFAGLYKKGYIYRGLKPVLWCPHCETALAQAEVEYGEHTSDSIYVRFALDKDPNGIFAGCENPSVVIWTTTPWTIPANMAVAVSPEFNYVLVKANGSTMLLLEQRVEAVTQACGFENYEVIKTIPGADLAGLVFKHPIFDRVSPLLVVPQDHKGEPFVTADDGTGIVHVAPGHGETDFYVGMANGIEVFNPVDNRGYWTDLVGDLAGLNTRTDGRERVLEKLTNSGALLGHSQYQHQYPHCWRCGSPLMFRATVQWFMNIDHNNHRESCLEAINNVEWFPSEGINRITAMVKNRPDWCLSRQRAWGVGIPAFYCESCEEPLMTDEAMESVAALLDREGSDAWFTVPSKEILPAGTKCAKCGGTEFYKEQDVLDVWFDSGSTHIAVLDARPELSWPSEVYLEGSDQHRGWFNTSLMVGMGLKGKAPYKKVITHGFVVDGNGRKMSKSLGNVLEPLDMISKFGADVLRLWGASSVYFEDISVSEDILKSMSGTYRDFRNTIRFMLGNLFDYTPENAVPFDQMTPIDRWVMGRLTNVVKEATHGYETFEFTRVIQAVNVFITTDLSPFYLDVLKDRLYADMSGSLARRSTQTALYTIAVTLIRVMAPILVHTCEEMWGYINTPNKAESVHLEAYPELKDLYNDTELMAEWAKIMEVRDAVGPKIEDWRQSFKNEAEGAKAKDIVEAMVTINAGSDYYDILSKYAVELRTILKVSKTVVNKIDSGLEVEIALAPGEKCPRCWLIREDIGVNSNHSALCGRCATAVDA